MSSLYVNITGQPSNLEAGKAPGDNQQEADYCNARAKQDEIATDCRQLGLKSMHGL